MTFSRDSQIQNEVTKHMIKNFLFLRDFGMIIITQQKIALYN